MIRSIATAEKNICNIIQLLDIDVEFKTLFSMTIQ